ncbi:hypothetical protein [Nocardiopsis sp. ATB16-24]|uniref:hypothetical protein n=1 Tax=Nocardiopsis sp. ATB16-24 TaxID=3019555 RepID=UPI0025579807|nr:hypothetical protein [Nocardiopsis sp. ATB16-24]
MDPLTLLPYAVALFLNGACALNALGLLLRSWRNKGRYRLLDRWDAAARTIDTLFWLLLALLLTPWTLLPVAVWYAVLALTAASVASAVLRWPSLPVRAQDRKATVRRVSALGTLFVLVALVAALLLTG